MTSTTKPTTGPVEVQVRGRSGWPEHLEGAFLRELEGGEASFPSSWLVVSPRTPWRKATMAAYSLVLVPAHPMRLTRILALPCSGAWTPAILPPRRWRS